MVVSGSQNVPDVNNIMGGMEHTASGVRMHNHRRKLRQRFDLVRKLGQGTYGKVQLGINKETGQEVAIKTIKKAKIETEADLVRIRREIQIMSSVQHPNIIHIYEVFENKEKMVLVMEYAAGGELYDYLSERKVLSESEARRIFRQVASAVYYCHKHKICHRDLKLENILLDETKSAKIADFGLSNVFDERRLLTTFCGSPLYASPEIVRGTPYHGPEVDCWSLGVLLYTLVYGAMPFDGSNFKRLVKQISSGDYYEPPKPSSASPLIRQMLLVDPAKRATVEDICSHWWVNESHEESCLELAEELANQTPVRLDLLLSLLPSAANGDAVVVGNKMDTSISCVPIGQEAEGDSMNEYYSSNSNAMTKVSDREPVSGAKEVQGSSKSTKKKREHDKDKEGAKRKRDEKGDDSLPTSNMGLAVPTEKIEASASDGPSVLVDGAQNAAASQSNKEADSPKTAELPKLGPDSPAPVPELSPPPKIDDTGPLPAQEGKLPAPSNTDSVLSAVCADPWPIASTAAAQEVPPGEEVNPSKVVEDVMEVDDAVESSANLPSPVITDHVDSNAQRVIATDNCVDGNSMPNPPSWPVETQTDTAVDGLNRADALVPAVGEAIDKPLDVVQVQKPSTQEPMALTNKNWPPSSTHSKTDATCVDHGNSDSSNVNVRDVRTPEKVSDVAPDSRGLPQSKSLGTLTGRTEESESGPPSTQSSLVAVITTPVAETPSRAPEIPSMGPAVPVTSQEDKINALDNEATKCEPDQEPEGTKDTNKIRSLNRKNVPEEQPMAGRSSATAASTGTESVRHSKILRQAELFNSLTANAKTEPKNTMTLERPKKVTIYGFKQVSDARRIYEPKPETKPMIVPGLKVSDAKKAFESAAAAAKPTVPPTQSTLPRRTLIQTPPNSSAGFEKAPAKEPLRQNQRSIQNEDGGKTNVSDCLPSEKVVVGGLGVKLGAVGKVTEIGMQIKTEDSTAAQKPANNSSKTGSSKSEAHTKSDTAAKNAPSAGTSAGNFGTLPQPAGVKPVLNAPLIIRSPELVNAAVTAMGVKAASPPVANEGTKKANPMPVAKVLPAAAATNVVFPSPIQQVIENEEIEVILDTGDPEPKVASMLVSGSTAPTQRQTPVNSSSRPSQTPPTHVPNQIAPSNQSAPAGEEILPMQIPSQQETPPSVEPPPSEIPAPVSPLKIASPTTVKRASPATSPKVSSPPATPAKPAKPIPSKKLPLSLPAPASSPASVPHQDERPAESEIVGSENSFLRNLRSPTREVQALAKRLSKGNADGNSELTITLPASSTPASPTVVSASSPQVSASTVRTPEATLPVAEAQNVKVEEAAVTSEDGKPQPIVKTEISFPVATVSSPNPRERIIPIQVEGRNTNQVIENKAPAAVAKPAQTSTSAGVAVPSANTANASSPSANTKPHAANSQTRQDLVRSPVPTESSDSLRLREPIRKSPREFIIPISVEGGGYVTPKEDALVGGKPFASGVNGTPVTGDPKMKAGRLDRTKRYGSLFHDGVPSGENVIEGNTDDINSVPQSPANQSNLQRLSSFGKGYGTERREEEPYPTHEIRRNGSGSSCDDDDDDDDTFQILTAESLFSTLLSRVRQLTRRSNRDNVDPFVIFRNSRYTSPAPSHSSQRSNEASSSRHGAEARNSCEASGTPEVGSPRPCSPSVDGLGNRNSIGSETNSRAFWSNLTTRNATDTDSRRSSTADSSRSQLQQGDHLGRHRSLSRDPSDGNMPRTASAGGSSTGNTRLVDDSGPPYSTSSLTRRVLNQHLRDISAELNHQRASQLFDDANSDAGSEASSASGTGSRSSLSRALTRLNSVLQDNNALRKEYLRTYSSRELGASNSGERRQQRYSRSSTAENINPTGNSRLGSPNSQTEEEISNYIPPTYRTFTRTSSREFLSPNSSRGTSPVTSLQANPTVSVSSTSGPTNPLVPQLSTVLEFGPQGTEAESPRPARAAETKKIPVAVVTSSSNLVTNTTTTSSTAEGDKKTRRVSRFLRPDFYDTPRSESAYSSSTLPSELSKQKFLKSVEKRWEKYNGNENPPQPAPKVSNEVAPVIVFVREIPSVKSPPPVEAKTAASRVEVVGKNQSEAEANPPVTVRVREINSPEAATSPKVSPTKITATTTEMKKNESKTKDGGGPKTTNEEILIVKAALKDNEARISKSTSPPAVLLTPAQQLQQVRQNLEHAVQVHHVEQQPTCPQKPLNSVPQPPNTIPKQPNALRGSPIAPSAPQNSAEKAPKSVCDESADQQQQPSKPVTDKSETNATKSPPKLTVRRQFEHLLNLAAAQFQRGQSPNKVGPAPVSASLHKNSAGKSPEAIGPQPTEIQDGKQPESEMQNTAPAASNSGISKHRNGSKPAVPVKPDFLLPLSSGQATVSKSSTNYSMAEQEVHQNIAAASSSNTNKSELARASSTSTLVAENAPEVDGLGLDANRPTQPAPKSVREPSTIESLDAPTPRITGTRSPLPYSYNGSASNVEADDDVRFARVKRLEALESCDFYYDDAPETPTDSYESSSVCSDLRDRDLRESGEDESVSERILRKSFYTRFNEASKKKSQYQQQQNRRSVSRDLVPDAPQPSSSTSTLPPRLPSKSRRASRDESAEAIMVRKFLSSRSENDPASLERRYLNMIRRQQMADGAEEESQRRSDNTIADSYATLRSSMSRENSVARSVKSDAASPTSSIADSISSVSTRDSRSYSRAYSSSRISQPSEPSTPSTPGESYLSSGSLNRRSYYVSSNTDHLVTSSLPRRNNRYSVHESEMSHSGGGGANNLSGGISRNSTGRSSYKGSVSRYSSIFEETGREAAILSPTSVRRNMASVLSDASSTLPSRRETTFYGMPNRESSLNRREGLSSSFFLRSTSSGLDYNGSSSSANSPSSSTYATMRPSYFRTHRR